MHLRLPRINIQGLSVGLCGLLQPAERFEDAPKVGTRFQKIWSDGQCLLVMRNGVFQFAQFLKQNAKAVVRIRITRLQVNDLPATGSGFVEPAETVVNRSQQIPRLRIPAIRFANLRQQVFCFLQTVLLQQGAGLLFFSASEGIGSLRHGILK